MFYFCRYFLICFLTGVIFLFSGFSPASGAEVDDFAFFSDFRPVIDDFTLSNGMRVVVVPDHRVPVVTHMIWLRAGAADEPDGLSGVAHYLEHLMFKDGSIPASQGYSEIVRRNGGRDNAFTSQDHTSYYFRVASDRLALVMRLEASRLLSVRASESQALSELDVVLEERRLRLDNSSEAKFMTKLDSFIWQSHPYSIPIVGTMEDIRGLTLSDVRAFHSRFYSADNMVLVLAGDITVSRARALTEEIYGVLPSSGGIVSSRPDLVFPDADIRVVYRDSRASNPILYKAYRVPSYVSGERGEGEVFDVLSYILGGGSVSRLYQDLVVEDRLASSAYSFYRGSLTDGGVFGIHSIPLADLDGYDYASLRDGISELESRIESNLRRIAMDGVSDEELSDAKRFLISDFIYSFDSQSSVARIFGHNLSSGLEIGDILDWPDRIGSVDGEDVRLAALSLLDKKSVTGWLVPLSGAEESDLSKNGTVDYEGQL